jgi:hypothetical protein
MKLDYYKQSPVDDPSGAGETPRRVWRGGGWCDKPGFARSAYRVGCEGGAFGAVGFRVARTQSFR